ncbi:hypothetical protein HLK59_10610 [Streptomyces sp. S3(2020)]|uniref:hypothetical protein n=1 Tax=Streptomyces sp. S3(2020) TaxID=2732044 RepID=UPI0014899178|nr:hypothetical protein [Streptomyces sp. S3(2020)]NNN30809.1 hypothetical protein [Streptomyces sp. S3(2020)]
MQTSSSATLPPTVWPARGRHVGSAAADVLRVNLQQLKDGAVVDDFLELKEERVFEARWRVDGEVTVRARLALGSGEEWVLLAEAERPWNPAWASPVGMFWPLGPDADWDHHTVAGLRFREVNRLPEDDKELRRLLRECVRDSWAVHIVVHEAMTPDDRGLRPLTEHLPPGLRHRVVEHRAAPHQLRAVNWALKEFDVQVPRGGAVVLPPLSLDHGTDADDFSVRSVFLDGTRPTELTDAVTRFAALPRPLPEDAEEALTALRERWRLTTAEEELVRQRELVAMYAEALDAMTKSRDLYREAAERANEALAAYREAGAEATPGPPAEQPGTPLRQLTRTLERFKPRRPPRDEEGVG